MAVQATRYSGHCGLLGVTYLGIIKTLDEMWPGSGLLLGAVTCAPELSSVRLAQDHDISGQYMGNLWRVNPWQFEA